MERKPALVTATAMTIATSAAVSGLFLTIANSTSAASAPAAQTITEYVVADTAAQAPEPITVVAEPLAPGEVDPFASFGEYFDDDSSEEQEGSDEGGDDE